MVATTLVLGAAYTALFTGLDSYNLSSYQAEVYTVLNRCLDRMFDEVASAHIGANTARFLIVDNFEENDEFGEIANDRMVFEAAVGKTNWSNVVQSDLAEIEYSIDTDDETPARWLVRRMQSPPDGKPLEGGDLNLLGPRVVGMNVKAYDGKEWVDEWDSSETLPQAVHVQLYILPSSDAVSPKRLETLWTTVWLGRAFGTGTGSGEESETVTSESAP